MHSSNLSSCILTSFHSSVHESIYLCIINLSILLLTRLSIPAIRSTSTHVTQAIDINRKHGAISKLNVVISTDGPSSWPDLLTYDLLRSRERVSQLQAAFFKEISKTKWFIIVIIIIVIVIAIAIVIVIVIVLIIVLVIIMVASSSIFNEISRRRLSSFIPWVSSRISSFLQLGWKGNKMPLITGVDSFLWIESDFKDILKQFVILLSIHPSIHPSFILPS